MSTTNIPVSEGLQVKVYVNNGHEKWGRWLSARPILVYDCENGTVTIPGKNGRNVFSEIEDIRIAIDDSPLATAIHESIDIIDSELSDSDRTRCISYR